VHICADAGVYLSVDEIETVIPFVSCHYEGHGCFKVAYQGVNKRLLHSQ
jgi:hypothetical protein